MGGKVYTTDYEGPDRRGRESWHIDRKIPLGIIAMFVLNGAAIVYMFAQLEGRVQNGERWDEEQDKKIVAASTLAQKAIDGQSDIRSNLARLDERSSNQTRVLERIEKTVMALAGAK